MERKPLHLVRRDLEIMKRGLEEQIAAYEDEEKLFRQEHWRAMSDAQRKQYSEKMYMKLAPYYKELNNVKRELNDIGAVGRM